MTRRLFRLSAAALLTIALASLAACTDDDTDEAVTDTDDTADEVTDDVDQEALDRVVDATQATIEEGTATFRVTAGARDVDIAQDTNQDTTQRVDVEIDGVVDFDADQRRLTFVGPQGTLDVIMDGSTAYLELPATEGDDWVRTDLDELLGDDVGIGGPAGLPFQDPADNLRVLEGNVIAAQREGTEQVDGEQTDVVRLVIDLEASAEDASDEVNDALVDMVQRTGARELEMWVWLDGDDLIRRVRYELDLDQVRVDDDDIDADADTVEADPSGVLLVTFDYSDFGADVDIELPDDENIIDIDEDEIRDAFDTIDS